MPNRLHNALHEIIKRQIEIGGPVSIATYMDICLAHPEHGYYRKNDPLGAGGDFITAPEVSQLFGEMVGIAIADWIIRMGNPGKVILCEMGPGRGTLMKDISRVLSKIPELDISIHLVETSGPLKEKQKEVLPDAIWHSDLSTLPIAAPIIFIANEFFDALSFRQMVKTTSGWRERVVGLENEKLVFGLGGILDGADLPDAPDNSVFEFSPVREAVWSEICRRVKAQKGAAIAIDYGHLDSKTGNSFQAVRNHNYADVLEHPGEQDLTSHVNFSKFRQLADGLEIDYFLSQGEFLDAMGIGVRAERLAAANPQLREDILSGLKRLRDADQMGDLFKVIGVSKCS